MRSYSAWNFRPGCCLATSRSRPWRRRTLSLGLRPRGELGRFASMPLRVLLWSTRLRPQGPFPPAALCCAAFVAGAGGTMVPSDFRCAMFDFVLDLYESPGRDGGGADGSLVFRGDPCMRAATRPPPRPPTRSRSRIVGVAFAVT